MGINSSKYEAVRQCWHSLQMLQLGMDLNLKCLKESTRQRVSALAGVRVKSLESGTPNLESGVKV
jgi:hypothetical protein